MTLTVAGFVPRFLKEILQVFPSIAIPVNNIIVEPLPLHPAYIGITTYPGFVTPDMSIDD